ncbi:MAG: nucleotide-binding protein [Polaromonas sp.]|nr:nucleotide-binding protein [Polaromonas sp.]
MYLLDTNTLIYFFKQQGQVAARLKSVAPSQISIPAVVLFELEYGVLRSIRPEVQRNGIDAALKVYGVLGLDKKAATSAAWIKYTLETAGTPIGHFDQLIAGTALAYGMTLVTRNTREFERVPGLRVENWFD